MMANDSNNVEFKHYNELAERFGIHWNENMRHDVIDNKFEQGPCPFLQRILFLKLPGKYISNNSVHRN